MPELLATLAVVAILAGMAAPGMREFVQNNRAAAQTNELIAALSLARSEALTRGAPVSVCASNDGASCSLDDTWETGWLVFVDREAPRGQLDEDDVLLRAFPALEGGAVLTSSVSAVTYRPDGFLDAIADTTFELEIPYCTGNQGRAISVAPTGRAAVSHVAC